MRPAEPLISSLTVALALGDLTPRELWVRYHALGGNHDEDLVRSYLEGGIMCPEAEHDLLALALNEHCAGEGLSDPASYTTDPEGASSSRTR